MPAVPERPLSPGEIAQLKRQVEHEAKKPVRKPVAGREFKGKHNISLRPSRQNFQQYEHTEIRYISSDRYE